MSRRLQVLIASALDAQVEKQALDRSNHFTGRDLVDRLVSLDAPTADLDQMLAEIQAGRV